MKKHYYVIILLACAAMALAGCGKNAEQKQMEADLNAEVASLKETLKTELDGAIRSVNAAMATHDSLIAASSPSARIHKSDDLKTASKKLKTVKTEMDNWMDGYNPYDVKMSHKDAMAQLNRYKKGLTTMEINLDAAISQANKAIANHGKDRKELQAKVGKRLKKPIS